MFKSQFIVAALALLIALTSADEVSPVSGTLPEKRILDFFKSAAELLQRGDNPSDSNIPDTIAVHGNFQNIQQEIPLKAVLESRAVGESTCTPYSIVNGDKNKVDYYLTGKSSRPGFDKNWNVNVNSSVHGGYSFSFRPLVTVNGSSNNITFNAYFNGTLITTDMKLLEDLFTNYPPKPSKKFHIVKYLASTWTDAHAYCSQRNMKLATFNSKEEYSSLLQALKREPTYGELWISAARLTIFPQPPKGPHQHFFYPTMNLASSIYDGELENGDCVYIAVSKDGVTWRADDCYKSMRRFICQQELTRDPFFDDVGTAGLRNVPTHEQL